MLLYILGSNVGEDVEYGINMLLFIDAVLWKVVRILKVE